jgi:hypothetical protein
MFMGHYPIRPVSFQLIYRNSKTSNYAVNEKWSGLCRNGSDRYGCYREIG